MRIDFRFDYSTRSVYAKRISPVTSCTIELPTLPNAISTRCYLLLLLSTYVPLLDLNELKFALLGINECRVT